MNLQSKKDYLEELKKGLDVELKKLSAKRDISEKDYENVKAIIMETADFSFDKGFEFARISYSITMLNVMGEVFKA